MATDNTHELLPTELWYPIISLLPSLDQKTCLSVSQTFHYIAATYLFSHVTISLGLWRPYGSSRQHSDEEKAAVKRQANAFYDISRHIMRSSDFAKKVKKSPSAHTPPIIPVGRCKWSCVSLSLVFKMIESARIFIHMYLVGLLADVLRALPDLRGFAWYGPRPTIPIEILEAVVSTAGDTLEELYVP